MAAKYTAAIIGCGSIAGGYDGPEDSTVLTHAQAYRQDPRCELVGCADPSDKNRQAFTKKWGVQKSFADSREMLRTLRPQMVSVCSPNALHAQHVHWAVEAGAQAVWCEKPMALDYSSAQKMVQLCQQKGIVLLVNYTRRWNPALQRWGQRLVQGEFGKIHSARVLYTKGLFHNASHAINLFQSWWGSPIRTVLANATPWEEGDVRAHFWLQFSDSLTSFQALDEKIFSTFEIELFTDQGPILFKKGGAEVVWNNKTENTSSERTLGLVLKNLVDCLENKASLAMPADEALETIRICETVRMNSL